jgi:hypothetical protein
MAQSAGYTECEGVHLSGAAQLVVYASLCGLTADR